MTDPLAAQSAETLRRLFLEPRRCTFGSFRVGGCLCSRVFVPNLLRE
ncbi:hypothetical protein AKJ09_06000 [Labilithrix luteola]|uniref:Uncharacterized protein n=1 Tax=Labilithrix luteola TaxID=1391654 RepID=A0A0K1Q134_9BACT|nr:hypothetical protein AKJ09_06000 [Labilithrix luteola]